MLFLLSPAKTLDETTLCPIKSTQLPTLLKHSLELVKLLQELSPPQIESLMRVSSKIALQNVERFNDFSPPESLTSWEKAKSAVFLFKGDVYKGLDPYNLSRDALKYLNAHVGILSGLYGYLNAFDLIYPYRLEMGTALANARGKNLYEFWGNYITAAINLQLKIQEKNTQQAAVLVNLASQEYFSSVNTKKINAAIITPIFKDQKNGQYKVISFYAKHARGLMVKYACEQQLKSVDDLKSFDTNGYYFSNVNINNPNEWVFYRDEGNLAT